MEVIFLYNTDGIENQLKNPKKVHRLQTQYAALLHKYLKSSHTEDLANMLFSNGLMLIHETEKVYNLSKNRLLLH